MVLSRLLLKFVFSFCSDCSRGSLPMRNVEYTRVSFEIELSSSVCERVLRPQRIRSLGLSQHTDFDCWSVIIAIVVTTSDRSFMKKVLMQSFQAGHVVGVSGIISRWWYPEWDTLWG